MRRQITIDLRGEDEEANAIYDKIEALIAVPNSIGFLSIGAFPKMTDQPHTTVTVPFGRSLYNESRIFRMGATPRLVIHKNAGRLLRP